jgi:hypothetical protein
MRTLSAAHALPGKPDDAGAVHQARPDAEREAGLRACVRSTL